MAIDYVSVDAAPVLTASGGKTGVSLLWGDRVSVLGASGSLAEIQTGRFAGTGHVKKSQLGGKSLLEFYFIDVGQGDGVLIRTPDHRHVLIDGGFPRRSQMTGKNAADFVDWKFVKDYRRQTIALDAVIASHNDADHFGGLSDLLSEDPEATAELDAKAVTVEAFYHAGLSWWKQGDGRLWALTRRPTTGICGRSCWAIVRLCRRRSRAAVVRSWRVNGRNCLHPYSRREQQAASRRRFAA